jgi:hypothetical protein
LTNWTTCCAIRPRSTTSQVLANAVADKRVYRDHVEQDDQRRQGRVGADEELLVDGVEREKDDTEPARQLITRQCLSRHQELQEAEATEDHEADEQITSVHLLLPLSPPLVTMTAG